MNFYRRATHGTVHLREVHAGLPSCSISSFSLPCWLISAIYLETNLVCLPCQPQEQRVGYWLHLASAAVQSAPFPLSHTGNPLLLFKLWPWGPPQVPGAFQDSSSDTHLKCLQRSMPTSCAQPVVRRLFSLLICWRGTRALDWVMSVPRVKAWRLLQTLYHFSLAFDLSLPIYQEQSSQTARVP